MFKTLKADIWRQESVKKTLRTLNFPGKKIRNFCEFF